MNYANVPKSQIKEEKKFQLNTEGLKLNLDWRTWKFSNKMYGYIMLIAVCGIVYIANVQYAERNVRKINKLQKEVEILRTDYTNMKATLILQGKRSVIRQKVGSFGLIENEKPVYKVVKKED
ncbi:MAG: FtsL-like putative cell division protein [Thermoflexibacter sp.]|jgi:hypothetical protein|nr:FtsL-like putative cell division protein [Thermoflexibacter sp.]